MYMKKIIFVLSVLLLFYSIFNILNWFNDSNSIAKESEKIINTIVTNNNIEIAEVPETVQTTNSSVDYSLLEQLNSDVVRVILLCKQQTIRITLIILLLKRKINLVGFFWIIEIILII